jgi:hypothetical protein
MATELIPCRKQICVSIVKTNQLMLFREVITAHPKDHKNNINKLYRQNAEFLLLKEVVNIVTNYALKQ